MKYSVDKQDRYTVFQVEEENLNSIVAPDLKSEIVILFNEGVNNLIFDLSRVKYVDSSGLSAILTADRLWKEQGSFVLTGIEHPAVQKLIEISRLDTVLSLVPTKAEAVEYVFMEELQRELEKEEEEEE
ncbi:STAS domain-containing protein [Haliscomenobacter hydrossis]|uniref:Sulfate transporter/antisigma-factor antagonist STAS n=1 Tax=Haliscomenobacter hydrossis (strain ATCC 27775 / DSM 1100 / LMG 10767 / O) TaxID=760192 RepID=F4L4Q5_HALH1|nr:STAS domain-containing protein [Haliscomenobacter hydrossis]AEE53003.1 Sulfate transporter/antisigma-factor antagonist STAS [Haliscomenobacter hydrossis DSM 1100]